MTKFLDNSLTWVTWPKFPDMGHMAKIPWHFFKIPWLFLDLEKILFSLTFPRHVTTLIKDAWVYLMCGSIWYLDKIDAWFHLMCGDLWLYFKRFRDATSLKSKHQMTSFHAHITFTGNFHQLMHGDLFALKLIWCVAQIETQSILKHDDLFVLEHWCVGNHHLPTLIIMQSNFPQLKNTFFIANSKCPINSQKVPKRKPMFPPQSDEWTHLTV